MIKKIFVLGAGFSKAIADYPLMNYFNDSLESRRVKQIVAEFRKHGLKAFEDIVEEVKKIGGKQL